MRHKYTASFCIILAIAMMVGLASCSIGGKRLKDIDLVGVWSDAGGGGINFTPEGEFESTVFYSSGTYQVTPESNKVFLVNSYREYIVLTPAYDTETGEWSLAYHSDDCDFLFLKTELTQLQERSESDYFAESVQPKIISSVRQILPEVRWLSDGTNGITFVEGTLQFWNEPPCTYTVEDAYWPDNANYGTIDFTLKTPDCVYTARLAEILDEQNNLTGYTLSIFKEGALFVSVFTSDVPVLTEGA